MPVAPLVSVLIPVRNGAAFLDAALASLASQSLANFEAIIVDNGSRDASREIAAGWARRDGRMRPLSLPAGGLAAALDLAAASARAPLLARLDADDIALPDRLASQSEALRDREELVLVGTAVELIDARGDRIGVVHPPLTDAQIRAELQTRCPLVQSSVMMRRSAFERAGGYRPGLNIGEDFDLFCRLAELGALAALPETLVRYRIHPDSLTSRQPARMAVAHLCVRAAAQARRQGVKEPFLNGSPRLWRALPLLGLNRAAARGQLRHWVTRSRLSRYYFALPLPAPFKRLARGAAERGRLGPFYAAATVTLSRIIAAPRPRI